MPRFRAFCSMAHTLHLAIGSLCCFFCWVNACIKVFFCSLIKASKRRWVLLEYRWHRSEPLTGRVWRVGFFNFGSGMDRVLEKIFRVGSGTDWVRVLVSNIESIGYYRVLKILIGYLSVFSLISHIFLWNINIQSIKRVFGGLICVFIGSNRSSLRHNGLLQVRSATFWNFHLAWCQSHTNHSGLVLMQLRTIQYLIKNHQNRQIY